MRLFRAYPMRFCYGARCVCAISMLIRMENDGDLPCGLLLTQLKDTPERRRHLPAPAARLFSHSGMGAWQGEVCSLLGLVVSRGCPMLIPISSTNKLLGLAKDMCRCYLAGSTGEVGGRRVDRGRGMQAVRASHCPCGLTANPF